jgi:hypothetical protein
MNVSDENQKRAHLTVVAEGNPEKARQDFEREYATDKLSWATRDLAANLIRILAGAGKSYELLSQVNGLVEAINAWIKVGGHATSADVAMERALRDAAESTLARLQERMYDPETRDRMPDEERDSLYDSGSFDIEGGKDDIVQGALRMMASRIIGQNTQERNAEHRIFQGIGRLKRGQAQSASYHSSPTFVAQRKRERERQRTEAANSEGKRTEAAKERERVAEEHDHKQVDAKKERGRLRERLEKPFEPTKKIGMYDALDEQQARAAKSTKDPEGGR